MSTQLKKRLLRLAISICLIAFSIMVWTPSGSSVKGFGVSSAQADMEVLRVDRGFLGTQVLDPMLSTSSMNWYLQLIYDGLVGVNPLTSKVSTDWGLAESFEMARDGLGRGSSFTMVTH